MERCEFLQYWQGIWASQGEAAFDKGLQRYLAVGESLRSSHLISTKETMAKASRAFLHASTRVVELLFLFDGLLAQRRSEKALLSMKQAFARDCNRKASALLANMERFALS